MDYIEIFPETTITEWPESYDENGHHVYSIQTLPLPIVEGEKYTVEWDGIRYECVAYKSDKYSENLVIGDITFGYPATTGGNGEPFAFWIYPDKNYGYLDTIFEGDHTVCVYQGTKPGTEEPEEPSKINWAKLMQIYHLEGFEMAWLAYNRMKGGGS